MSGGIIYSFTPKDVRDAIRLLNILGSNPTNELWCSGWPDNPGQKAPCGHYGDWQCAAEAIGASIEAANLVTHTSCTVMDAWSGILSEVETNIVITAPRRHGGKIWDADLEAENLMREGWLPLDCRITRRRHPDHGRYIDLHWDDTPEAYYVRGHVSQEYFEAVMRHRFPRLLGKDEKIRVRHAHAWWAFNGSEYGEPKRTLAECGAMARGAFDVTVMDVPNELADVISAA